LPYQTKTRSSGPWTSKSAVNSASSDSRAQQLRLKPFADEISNRHRSPTQQTILVFLSETAERQPDFSEMPQVRRRRLVNRWRRHRDQWRQHATDAREAINEFRITARVVGRKLFDLGDSRSDVVVNAAMSPIRREREHARRWSDHLQPMPREI